MPSLTIPGPAAPRRSSQETKSENTTRVAMEMIDAEARSRDAKTAKLREARLAREIEEEANKPAPVKKVVKAKSASAAAKTKTAAKPKAKAKAKA